jgi:putative SOS response-associated peptidase YedK
METAAIVTTEANRTMGQVHHRAPVIVPPEGFDFWLDCRNVDELAAAALLTPAAENLMEVYEISPAVNKVANDSAELLQPYTAPPEPPVEPKPAARPKRAADDRQGSLF